MSPDTLHHGPVPAGRLRIYLGYAPGAGTTCAMLSEGHRRAERGTDVVVASARTHGRAHTAGLLAGLEVLSPVTIPHEGTAVAEMDLGTVLARRPTVALVDDLADHNAPGARHADLSKASQNREVIAFADHWKAVTGSDPALLIRDSKLTTQAVLAELDDRQIGFIALRARHPPSSGASSTPAASSNTTATRPPSG